MNLKNISFLIIITGNQLSQKPQNKKFKKKSISKSKLFKPQTKKTNLFSSDFWVTSEDITSSPT